MDFTGVMAKYKKRPVIVDAEQWFPGKEVRGVLRTPEHDSHVMTAHEQRVYLQPGDWIIAEPDGRGYYPCKPDIFASTYEAVETP